MFDILERVIVSHPDGAMFRPVRTRRSTRTGSETRSVGEPDGRRQVFPCCSIRPTQFLRLLKLTGSDHWARRDVRDIIELDPGPFRERSGSDHVAIDLSALPTFEQAQFVIVFCRGNADHPRSPAAMHTRRPLKQVTPYLPSWHSSLRSNSDQSTTFERVGV